MNVAPDNGVLLCDQSDHLRVTAIDKSGNIAKAFSRLKKLLELVQKNLEFSRDDRFGFLTFDPANVGTGLRAQVSILSTPIMAQHYMAFQCNRYH